jgi:predicted phosphodiesterase
MKIGVISDVHSNYDALKAVSAFFREQKPDKIFSCGDNIGYGAQPNECIEELKKLGVISVAGNHEYGIRGLLPTEYFNDYAKAALEWTRAALNKESMDFIDGLPLSEVDETGIRIVHGSPDKPEYFNYIFTLVEAGPALKSFEEDICFVGHSHIPRAFYYRKKTKIYGDITGDKFYIEDGLRYIINPGGVGQPRDRDTRAAAGIYDTEKKLFQVTRLEYDIKAAQDRIKQAGLPEFLSERLKYGI